MNRQEYLKQIEARNGTCRCPDMQELYSLRTMAEEAKKRCESTERESELASLSEADLEFLAVQKSQLTTLRETAQRYHTLLDTLARAGKIRFFNYRSGARKEVPYPIAKKISRLKTEIVTANCLNCNQQIDLIEV